MPDASQRQKSSFAGWNLGALITSLAAVATIVAAVVNYVTLADYASEREDEIKRATYALTVTQDMLLLSAPEGTIVPTTVSVRPVFDVPGEELIDGIGAASEPYEGFRVFPHTNGIALRIPGVRSDVCSVPENVDRCSRYEIVEYKVDYSFGRFGARSGYVPVGPRS